MVVTRLCAKFRRGTTRRLGGVWKQRKINRLSIIIDNYYWIIIIDNNSEYPLQELVNAIEPMQQTEVFNYHFNVVVVPVAEQTPANQIAQFLLVPPLSQQLDAEAGHFLTLGVVNKVNGWKHANIIQPSECLVTVSCPLSKIGWLSSVLLLTLQQFMLT